MNRGWAAFGSGIGAVAGAAAGSYLAANFHGRTPRGSAMMTGEVVGMFVGAALGAYLSVEKQEPCPASQLPPGWTANPPRMP